MEDNVTLYRVALSLAGGLIIGGFGVIVGAAWAVALGLSVVAGVVVVGLAGLLWGAVCFQLTPTGGVIMENKTTVNYAVVALHGWITAFLCILALVVWAVRVWVF